MKELVILYLAIISVTASKPFRGRCGPYEEIVHCNCQPGQFCPANCPPSCACIDGYERNKYGDCRKIYQSMSKSPKCGANEHWSDCGDYIQATCEEPDASYQPAICSFGCFCNEGYVRNSQGVCIKFEECF